MALTWGTRPKGVTLAQCVLPEDRHAKFGSRGTRTFSKFRKYGIEPVAGARLQELLEADRARSERR